MCRWPVLDRRLQIERKVILSINYKPFDKRDINKDSNLITNNS